jgi:hypothetical protein
VGKGARSRAVPTRQRPGSRCPPTRGHGARCRCTNGSSRQAPLPTLQFNFSTRSASPYSLLAICLSHFLFPTRYSLFAFFISLTPMRSVRSADGARMHARHPSRHAMTGMQTPLSDRHRPPRPPCDHCAPRASPACDRFPHIGQARRFFANRASPTFFRKSGKPDVRACGEASCVPSDGTLAFRRSTWDFWPGPVLAVVRQSLQDRAATFFAARVIVTRRSRSREPPRRSR